MRRIGGQVLRARFARTPFIITLIAGLAACSGADRQPPPDAAEIQMEGPELVGPGVISTPDRNQTFPAENPGTGALWFSVYDDDFDSQTIMFASRTPDGWATPTQAPFSGRWGDRAPRFDVSGDTLYFTSNRPGPGIAEGDWNIWRTIRRGETWDEPTAVDSPVNTDGPDIHAAVTPLAMWVASRREGSLGRSDIFRVSRDGRVEHLPAPVNDANSQPDLWVSPDESWMILVVTDGASGHGGDDLYLSRRKAEGWTTPENLGPVVNSGDYEYGPWMSRDGTHLYFTSHRNGSANIYRIPAAEALNGTALPAVR